MAGRWAARCECFEAYAPIKEEKSTVEPPDGDSLTVQFALTGTTGDGMPINIRIDAKADG